MPHPPTRRFRRAGTTLAGIAATLACLFSACLFTTTAAATAAPAPADAVPPPATWSVQPSTEHGPDDRPAFRYALAPGARQVDYVAVTNVGDEPLTVDLYAQDAFTTASGGFDLLAAGRPAADVGAWIRLKESRITVPPHARSDVPFELAVPADASPGDHAGGIVASLAGPGRDRAGNRVVVDRRVGTRMYLRVDGPLRPALTSGGLSASLRTSLDPRDGALNVTYTVRNSGNIRLGARPDLTVRGPWGLTGTHRKLGPLPELLPGASLTRTVRVSGVTQAFRLDVDLALHPTPVPGGSPDTGPTTHAHTTVRAIPWSAMATAAALLALITARLLHRRRRRGSTRPTEKASPPATPHPHPEHQPIA
ncbi:WxL protein peptidoglycan domain-containing protein [Embleya sp. NPDC059237]|uniref:WxL protein peptidoglycan domain-containing protein n=1 Tax=Embleya sp. NPDC059237 TaxID=3346784 RepID=UPI0036875545